ncbi:MAG TPA: aminotransferase class V-fold PLP-dependent enzyme, partial [Gaiellaceae bacterium]
MAVTAGKKLDARTLRADFPIFQQEFHGKPLAFLDSAASSQKPRQMLEAMDHFYETSYANVHRGVYELAERATEALEHARERMRAFLNAPHAHEVIFVRNATEAINLVAYAWGLWNLGPGDIVVVSELEHHSNFVPWQYIGGKRGAELRMVPLDDHGELDLSGLDELARGGNVKVVATNLVSNSLGTINPVDRLVAWAHEQGAIFVCDAAQAAPHMKLDVQALGADFVAVSGHKMCGPSGAGALW